jgi:hypothetical protein
MVLTWCRVLLALLGFSALVTEVATLVERGRFEPGNFFSFFTVEANLLAVLALLVSAVARRSAATDFVRGASTLFMVLVFVVFSLLLSGLDPSRLTAVPWDNTVLHHLMPIAVLLDWLVDPPARPIPFRRAALWLVVPLVYVVYSLVRGSLVGWYPYPFLDVGELGWGQVLVTCAVITLFVLVAARLVTLVRPRGSRRRAR